MISLLSSVSPLEIYSPIYSILVGDSDTCTLTSPWFLPIVDYVFINVEFKNLFYGDEFCFILGL